MMNLFMNLILMMSLLMERKTNIDDDEKKFFTSLPTCYSMFSAFDSQDVVHSYCPFTKHNKCWHEKNALVTILDGYDCNNKAFQADGLRHHTSTQHSKMWCGMGVQIFLQELYPKPTGCKQSSSNKFGKKHKSKKTQSSRRNCQCQLWFKLIAFTHISKKSCSGSGNSTYLKSHQQKNCH